MNAFAVIVALLFVVGLLVERLLLRFRFDAYFMAGFPLFPELVPLPEPPRAESGRTLTVVWERQGDLVRFWAQPGKSQSPMGLHGAVRLVRGPRGVHLPVRWSPPWSPLLAAAWLAGLGLVRGDGLLMVPVAVGLMLVILYVYHQFAMKAAAELRWAWVRGGDEGEDEDEPL